jgi:hypothetical protein
MARKAKRTMAEYKLVVDKARVRRKQKEKENKELLDTEGEHRMRSQQDMLMMGKKCVNDHRVVATDTGKNVCSDGEVVDAVLITMHVCIQGGERIFSQFPG